MYLVDSHCHLDQIDKELFPKGLETILANAREAEVKYLLCVCITLQDFPTILRIAKAHNWVSVTCGLHPNEKIATEPQAEDLIYLANDEKVIGIGETGLDYYRSDGDLAWQQDRFRAHIKAAKTLKKPLIVHTRKAKEDTIRILKEENASEGVLHCFTEDWEMAKKALDLGFYVSFSGIVTFKNAGDLQSVAKKVPLDRMLIETDSPYLAPAPYRGKINQPAWVRLVAEFLADLRGIPMLELAEITTANFFSLFKDAKKIL